MMPFLHVPTFHSNTLIFFLVLFIFIFGGGGSEMDIAMLLYHVQQNNKNRFRTDLKVFM